MKSTMYSQLRSSMENLWRCLGFNAPHPTNQAEETKPSPADGMENAEPQQAEFPLSETSQPSWDFFLERIVHHKNKYVKKKQEEAKKNTTTPPSEEPAPSGQDNPPAPPVEREDVIVPTTCEDVEKVLEILRNGQNPNVLYLQPPVFMSAIIDFFLKEYEENLTHLNEDIKDFLERQNSPEYLKQKHEREMARMKKAYQQALINAKMQIRQEVVKEMENLKRNNSSLKIENRKLHDAIEKDLKNVVVKKDEKKPK